MSILTVHYSKTLKLTNVVITELAAEMIENVGLVAEQMDNYIKSKGFRPLGPHIQYNGIKESNPDKIVFDFKILRQSSGFINNIEKPYTIESILRISNCLYVRYCGSAANLKFAYDKLTLTAFEEDIILQGNGYTVFLDETGDQIIADIFMERVD